MKALPVLLCCLVIALGLSSCDNSAAGEKTPPEPAANTTTNTQPSNTPPPSPESQNLSQKQAAQTKDRQGELASGLTVGKAERVEAPVVDDAGVSYNKVAQAICSCSSSFIGKDDQQGPQEISKDDPRYKEAVACSLKKKNQITDKALNRQKLVRAIQQECKAIPPGLVMSFILSLEK